MRSSVTVGKTTPRRATDPMHFLFLFSPHPSEVKPHIFSREVSLGKTCRSVSPKSDKCHRCHEDSITLSCHTLWCVGHSLPPMTYSCPRCMGHKLDGVHVRRIEHVRQAHDHRKYALVQEKRSENGGAQERALCHETVQR